MINRCCKHEKAVLNITTETKQQQQQQIGANKYQKPRSHLQDCKTFLQVVGAKQNRVRISCNPMQQGIMGERSAATRRSKKCDREAW
jgi:hypothetical protein